MPKIKYVGTKPDGETAFSLAAGAPAIWMAGDVFEVAEPLAAKMLQHPDVFALDAPEQTSGSTEPTAPASNSITKPDGTAVQLDGMSKEDLHALAKELGVAVHHNAGADKVIAALTAPKAE